MNIIRVKTEFADKVFGMTGFNYDIKTVENGDGTETIEFDSYEDYKKFLSLLPVMQVSFKFKEFQHKEKEVFITFSPSKANMKLLHFYVTYVNHTPTNETEKLTQFLNGSLSIGSPFSPLFELNIHVNDFDEKETKTIIDRVAKIYQEVYNEKYLITQREESTGTYTMFKASDPDVSAAIANYKSKSINSFLREVKAIYENSTLNVA